MFFDLKAGINAYKEFFQEEKEKKNRVCAICGKELKHDGDAYDGFACAACRKAYFGSYDFDHFNELNEDQVMAAYEKALEANKWFAENYHETSACFDRHGKKLISADETKRIFYVEEDGTSSLTKFDDVKDFGVTYEYNEYIYNDDYRFPIADSILHRIGKKPRESMKLPKKFGNVSKVLFYIDLFSDTRKSFQIEVFDGNTISKAFECLDKLYSLFEKNTGKRK